MALSNFESRKGSLSCTPSELFGFVTDIRNLRQFVPDNVVEDLSIDKDTCSFSVPAMGTVNIHLSGKEPVNQVVYNGTALQSNDFSIILDINGNSEGKAEVLVKLEANINPILRIMAAGPITDFLERLVDEMERFKGWKQKQ